MNIDLHKVITLSLICNVVLWFVSWRRKLRYQEVEKDFRRYRENCNSRQVIIARPADISNQRTAETERDLLHTAVVYLYTREQLATLTPEELARDREQYAQLVSKNEASESSPSVVMEQSQRQAIWLLEWMDKRGMRSHATELVRRAVVRAQ